MAHRDEKIGWSLVAGTAAIFLRLRTREDSPFELEASTATARVRATSRSVLSTLPKVVNQARPLSPDNSVIFEQQPRWVSAACALRPKFNFFPSVNYFTHLDRFAQAF
jgi:hypothetical protein